MYLQQDVYLIRKPTAQVIIMIYKKTKPLRNHFIQEIEDEEPQEYKPRRRKRKFF